MQKVNEAASAFLANKRVAVTGGVPHTQDPREQQRVPAAAGPWL
jgi:hypothetical protein